MYETKKMKGIKFGMVIFQVMLIVIFCGSLTKAAVVEQPIVPYSSSGYSTLSSHLGEAPDLNNQDSTTLSSP